MKLPEEFLALLALRPSAEVQDLITQLELVTVDFDGDDIRRRLLQEATGIAAELAGLTVENWPLTMKSNGTTWESVFTAIDGWRLMTSGLSDSYEFMFILMPTDPSLAGTHLQELDGRLPYVKFQINESKRDRILSSPGPELSNLYLLALTLLNGVLAANKVSRDVS